MSKFIDGWNGAAAGLSTHVSWSQYLADEFPTICQALVGVYVKSGENGGVPPMTLMLFGEGDRLKFCLSPRSSSRCFFGTVDDPSKVLESIEQALEAGRGEWKTKRGRGG